MKKPGMKTGRWTPDEDNMILALVQANGRKWSLCAAELEGRTGSQVRERYLNHLDPRLTPLEPWSEADDNALIGFVHKWGKKWVKIAPHMHGRSTMALRNRWKSSAITQRLRSMDTPLQVRKIASWTAEEDNTILELHDNGTEWRQIAEQLPGRSEDQIRDRFAKFLDPERSLKRWTEAEDRILIRERKLDKTWKEISRMLHGRTARACKGRWDTDEMIRRREEDRVHSSSP